MSGRGAERILDMIEWMAGQPAALSLAELSTALAIPKSSALMLVRKLVGPGYVERTEAGKYRLLRLPGERSDDNAAWDTLMRVITPLIDDGVENLAETGCLAVLSPRLRIKYLSKAVPRREIVYDRDISIDRAAHDVASGVVLLGALGERQLADYLSTCCDDDMKAFVTEKIRQAVEQGYFINTEGRIEGAAGAAAPVFDASGAMVAAINYCGPKERFASNIDQAVAQVVTTARLASDELKRRFRVRTTTREEVRNDT